MISEMAFEPSAQEHASADCPEGWLIGHLPVQEHPELAAATSPLSYLQKDVPTPPVLIMHGSRDMTVNFQQSVHLYEALRAMDKEVELVKLLGADHGFLGFACDEALAGYFPEKTSVISRSKEREYCCKQAVFPFFVCAGETPVPDRFQGGCTKKISLCKRFPLTSTHTSCTIRTQQSRLIQIGETGLFRRSFL